MDLEKKFCKNNFHNQICIFSVSLFKRRIRIMNPNEKRSGGIHRGKESMPSSISGPHSSIVDNLRAIMKAKEKREKERRRARKAAAISSTEPSKIVEISIAQHLFGNTSEELSKKDPHVKFVRITADQVISFYIL